MAHVGDIKECVAFLYADILSKGSRATLEKKPFGTCFIVFAKSADQAQTYFYLVTAKHVYDNLCALTDGEIYVRVNKAVPDADVGVSYEKLSKDGWLLHTDPAVDLAVYPWKPDLVNLTFVANDLAEITTAPEYVTARGGYWPPLEGEPTLLIGMMIQHQGTSRNFPIVRRGHIALVPEEKLPAKVGLANFILVEGTVYPGNSGAPVFVEFRLRDFRLVLFLIGVLSAAWDTPEELFVKSDGGGKTEYYNLGVSKVVPVDKLLDILNAPALQKQRDAPKDDGAVELSAAAQFTREDFDAALRRVARRTTPSQSDEASSGT